MNIGNLRSFLLARGAVTLYALFIAGYFLLPMATGHRELFYLLIMPLPLLLWREILQFYRGNALTILLLVYMGFMMMSLLWTDNFDSGEAAAAVWYSLALLSFCLLSGFIWVQYPQRVDGLARRVTWLAAPVALTSIIAWYLDHPFPASRLEPLGVMHHPNKAACAYGVFLLLCTHYLFTEQGRRNKALYAATGAVILSLILLTQSRTALAGICVGLLVLLGVRALWVIVFGLAASWYVAPWLADRPARLALIPLIFPHAFRHLGLNFLVPGLVSPSLPGDFASAAAYGDLASGLLAILCLFALRRSWALAIPVVWLFNVVGTLDLLNALRRADAVPDLAATWYIPTFFVPILLVTHFMIFVRLVRRAG